MATPLKIQLSTLNSRNVIAYNDNNQEARQELTEAGENPDEYFREVGVQRVMWQWMVVFVVSTPIGVQSVNKVVEDKGEKAYGIHRY